jgi:aconitate hydratase
MGILPLQFEPGQNAESLNLKGEEIFDVIGLKEMLDAKFANGKKLVVVAENQTGTTIEFPVTVRIDTPQEILYYQHGGILQYVLRQLAGAA